MKKELTLSSIFINILRFIVAGIFIFSGIVKLNDPAGLGFKIDEYFAPDVFDIVILQSYSYIMGLTLIILEVILGVMLILGYRLRLTLNFLLMFTIFFGFLTFYSAYFNKVTDCGCFGDAIKFTPWQSFYKDLVLFVMIIIIKMRGRYVLPLIKNESTNKAIAFLCLVLSVFIARYIYISLPIIDFRPYKININISKTKEIPEDAPKDKYEDTWIYKVDGKEKKYKTSDEPWNIPNAEYVNRTSKLIQKGYEPPIHDFVIENNMEMDVTDSILNVDMVYVVFSYDMDKMSEKGILEINKWIKKTQKDNVILITSTQGENLNKLKNKYSIDTPIFNLDNTVIKTIIRSNPGVVLLEKGTIIDKKNWRDIEEIK